MALAFDGCVAPTPTPSPTPHESPKIQGPNDDLVTVLNPSLLSGVPGATLTLRGTLTNTTSQPYVFGGYGFIFDSGAPVLGNTPETAILALPSRLSTDPIPPNTSTGEVAIVDVLLNPTYAGPFPRVINFTFYTNGPRAPSGIATFSVRILPPTDPSRPPVLYTDPCTQRAVAFDSIYLTTEPFALENSLNFSSDQRTRLTLFAWNMNLKSGEGAAAVAVQALDSQQTIHPLPVEFVSDVAGQPGLTQIIVRLPDGLPGAELRLRVLVHGLTSNEAPMAIKPS